MTAKPAAHNNEGDFAEDLAADLVSATDYSFSVRPQKRFMPWHKPRKQFVRHEQWSYYIQELVTQHRPGDALTYFGLPGVDLLDIRYFGAHVCEPNDIKLRFLGFDRDASPDGEQQAEFNISYDEVSKTASFDPQSEVIGFDIRDLADDASIAWQKTLEFGPYDVVNLDLCDGIAKEPAGKHKSVALEGDAAEELKKESETYYDAISKLLAVQARKKSPWLLFLTTRVGKQHIHNRTLDRFCDIYRKNLANCQSFKDVSTNRFGIADAKAVAAARVESRGLQHITLVGLCKWLLGFALGQIPQTAMEVKNVLGYRVKDGAEVEDMVSLAIRFDPTHAALPDRNKLAAAATRTLDECDLATKATRRIAGLIDVDAYLESQTDIRNEMVDAMCKLLESARYDIDSYKKWATA